MCVLLVWLSSYHTCPIFGEHLCMGKSVSIHALAWRATPLTPRPQGSAGRFNPRPRVEGDQFRRAESSRRFEFQSTPSRGGRPATSIQASKARSVSIHALAWRATWRRAYDQTPIPAFQSTPSRGGRPAPSLAVLSSSWFQSTPSRGGRPDLDRSIKRKKSVSIHALAWRATF